MTLQNLDKDPQEVDVLRAFMNTLINDDEGMNAMQPKYLLNPTLTSK